MDAARETATPTTFDLSKAYVGECQCCFQFQVTKGHEQLAMVLHGYQRPGDGWIVGRCWGVGELPFELSCERTKEWRENVKQAIKSITKTIADLRADRVEKLWHEIIDEEATAESRRLGFYKTVYKLVEIERGWVHPLAPRYSDTFDSVRRKHLNIDIARKEQMEGTLKFLNEKIDSWSYRPEALMDHKTWEREQARKSEAEREAARNVKRLAKARKAFNLAFRYVGMAINKHRAGYRNTTVYGTCYDTFEQQLKFMQQGLHVYISVLGATKGEREMLTPEQLEDHSLPPFETMYPNLVKKAKKVRS